MTPDLAQTLAVKALAWMVGEDDLREVFLGASGACMDDAWVTRFCDDVGIANYMDPMMARQALPGGEQVNWT